MTDFLLALEFSWEDIYSDGHNARNPLACDFSFGPYLAPCNHEASCPPNQKTYLHVMRLKIVHLKRVGLALPHAPQQPHICAPEI